MYANKGIKNSDIEQFCDGLEFPELSEKSTRELDKNITEEEAKMAMCNLLLDEMGLMRCFISILRTY